jgi:hypothetical protein
MTSELSKMGGGRVLSGWNGMDDSTKPIKKGFWVGEMAWMIVPSRSRSTYMPNSTFWGLRWCCLAMQTCVLQCPYSFHTLCRWPQYYPRWLGEEFWVGEMAWMTVQAIQDPTYMTNSMFWSWRWSRIEMRMCSTLTLCGWPQYYPRWVGEEFWVGEMAWMTVPRCPRFQLHA